ncbi:type III CRISPR-associated RAMP protein Csx7 [Defluviitalea phaphyphila]|uniref:type III CRISPR-associated RAMP protein Csx7 n=1 Tax=Defluviitalea phaphyphila TaxID=1473580 RepID=UPI000731C0CF|nr:CRISPR-associated RAMP protein Csx7 [Defluviitalea phaphyphila]
MLFNKFQNKYIIKGTLYALTPLHIGSGQENFDPVLADNTVIRDHKGIPYIPGSSLKGTIRSYIERILYSGVYKGLNSCLIVNEPCVSDDDIKKIKKEIKDKNLNDKKEAEEIYSKLCSVCKLFGSNYFASKIHIRDANLKSGEKVYIDMRDGVAIDRDTGTENNKYDFECVSSGSKFDFYMTVDNIEDELLEILKLIISILKNGDFRIGGKTSAGLGSIQLQEVKIYKITMDNLKTYLEKGLEALEEMEWENV